MVRALLGMALCVSAFGFVPNSLQAQLFRRPFHECCETCELPHANCSCTQTRPVVQTQLRAQQVTTYRDVVETRVRNETFVENVPTTTVRNVTVDEGGYQMVWVPKPVTKQVAQTVVQQQVKTRAVPYQVMHRVPQVSTQLVPVQTVQHVTETVPMMSYMPPAISMQSAGSCGVCNGNAHAHSHAFPTLTAAPAHPTLFVSSVPTTSAAIPTMPAINVPLPQTAQGPTPIATESSIDQWQTIQPRGAADTHSKSYDAPSSRTVPVPVDEARSIPRRTSSRFVPAPSAATVWNSRIDSASR